MRFTDPELCRLVDAACHLPDDEVSRELLTKLQTLKSKIEVKPLKFSTIQQHQPKHSPPPKLVTPKSVRTPKPPSPKKPPLPYKVRYRFNPDDGREVF